MQKIKVLINKEYKKIERTIKNNDNLFNIAFRKGLSKKEGNSYLFIGDYEELIALTKNELIV